MRPVLILLLLGGLLAGAQGRIFRRQTTAHGTAVFTATPAWQTLFNGAARVNAGRGQIQVIGAAEPFTAVLPKLRAAFPEAEITVANNGQTTLRTTGEIIRVFEGPPLAGERAIFFVLTQSLAEADRSRAAPTAHQLPALLVYPNSNPRLYLESESTRTRLELSETAAPASEVLDFFRRTLAAAGWSAAGPEFNGGRSAAELFCLFAHGQELCAVMAAAGGVGQATRVAVLHKHDQTGQ